MGGGGTGLSVATRVGRRILLVMEGENKLVKKRTRGENAPIKDFSLTYFI